MSKETRERGERKREEIRRIIHSIMKECVKEKKSPEECAKTVIKHTQVIIHSKPQEKCLVESVMMEMNRDIDAFCKRQEEKLKHGQRSETKTVGENK
jgi:hypothetical protein